MNVSVAVAVPLAGNVNPEIAQVISSLGMVAQVDEERLPEPVSPPWLVNVRVVEADFPGAEMVSAVGFADTENVGD